nr:D-amino acid dehydrogenase [Phyllobacterium zundukense]
MSHIAIIGAGITGVTTAYALLERGYSVTVIDRQRYAGMETSFANGGQLSASNAEVWNHWSTVLKGMKWMLRSDAPLLMNPKPTWHKYAWLAEFVSNIMNYRDNTVETTRLAIAARKHLFAIAERENIDFDHVQRGILHVYWDKPSFQHALKVNSMLVEGGLDRRPVTASEVKAIEPALHGDFHGGFYTPSDSTGDIHKFTYGLAQACERRGARFVFDATVNRIARDGLFCIGYSNGGSVGDAASEIVEADGVVVCAGAASRHFAAMLGDRVNIYPVKGYSITVHLDDERSQKAAPWVSLLDDRAKIVTSRLGEGRFRVAGTRVQWHEPRHPRRPRQTAGRLDANAVSRRRYQPRRALGRPQADDAQHDATGRQGPPGGRVLQHRPWPSRLDAVGRHRPDDRRDHFRRLPQSGAAIAA